MLQIVSLTSILIAFYALFIPCNACKTPSGSVTAKETVEVGSPFEITCTLSSNILHLNGKDYYVNASQLMIIKTNTSHSTPVDDRNVHIISTLAIQWRINSSTDEDSGKYACSLNAGNKKRNICLFRLTVGRKPQKSSIDFRCTSNYKVLNCRWKTEPSKLKTESILNEVARFPNNMIISTPCPKEAMKRDNNEWQCSWSQTVYPPFTFAGNQFEFQVETSNIFGKKSDTYNISHYEIVLPGKPEKLNVLSNTANMIEMHWSRPAHMGDFPYDLLYQIILEPRNQLKSEVINTSQGSAEVFYKVSGLAPNTVYDIVVRCRSPYAKGEDMWSDNATISHETMGDVPYLAPDIAKEAFEVIKFQHYRTIIIRWKNIPKEYWNGEDFHYKISVDQIHWPNKREKYVADIRFNATYASFHELKLDSAYHFKIFSANKYGSSRNYSSIIVNHDAKLLDVPENITVISYFNKEYNISWQPPSRSSTIIKNYTLFWCDKPPLYVNHCEGSLHWEYITETNKFLSITDEGRDFQFAVSANSENSTSGMTWAPCVVPHNGKPSKPDLKFCYATSTSMFATLKLKCRAEKALIKESYILYCKVSSEDNKCDGGPEIKKRLPDSAECYEIKNLVPFTLYGAYFRVVTYDGESIDGDIQYQQTLPDAPNDSPRDIKALNVTNSSIEISWKPPEYPNGIITSYSVEYNDISYRINSSSSNKGVLRKKIMPFTNYTIVLKACVNDKCSPPSEPLHVLTDIGIPGEMREPQIEVVNASWANVQWDPPLNPNGPIDYYLLHVKAIEGYSESHTNIINIAGGLTSTVINVDCPAIEKGIRYSFQLQPVNSLGSERLLGKKTAPTSKVMCHLYSEEGFPLEMILSIVIGSAVGCAILLIISYMFIRWMKKKYDSLKTIKVLLPKGLDTPTRFAPGTYQECEKELWQHCPYPVQRQGSFSSDSIKNRHGSGSSQYSNYSTEKLLIRRSNHCGVYCRNPSGDSSSGCSSTGGRDSIISCHTSQTHISTDSGAEIDLSPVSAKDNVFLDEKVQEPTAFIVGDVREKSSNGSEITSGKEHKLEKNHKMEAYASIAGNGPSLYSAYIQPYSKFGVNQVKDGRIQNCSRQYGILPYLRNLANSEPSVAELDFGGADDYGSNLIPYSKLTFSKSLENMSGNDVGYSRCDIIDDNAICDVPNAIKLMHFNANKHQNDTKIGNANFTSSKPYYVGIRKCLEEGNNIPKLQMPPLTENAGAIVSDNAIDSMAYSKFDINPSGLLSVDSRINTKATAYIPLQKAMLQAMNIPCSSLNNAMNKELSHSNVSLPAEIVISAIIDPCVEQCAINGSSYVPLDHSNAFFCTNHVGNQEITPVSLSCDRTDEKPTTSLSDINLNIGNHPEETYNSKKLGTNEKQTSADEQTQLKSNYLKESEVVVSPGSLNCCAASVPEYRFHGQSNKVEPVNSKSGYIKFSPVYYV